MRGSLARASGRIALAAAILLVAALAASAVYRYRPLQPGADNAPPDRAVAFSVLAAPRPLPPIRFTDIAGHALSVADFRGRVVLLNFWATWCGPCRREMPALDRLAAELGGKEFVVLPVSIDRDSAGDREGAVAVKRFYKELGLEKLGIYFDPSGRSSAVLDLPGIPTTLLIDRQGREVARKLGEAEWDSAKMIALIRRYLPPGASR